MIFDMTRRSSGGGSGPSASDAILTVTVPTGSTVTATKGGTTLTPTMWVQAADATLDCALFVIGPSLFDAVNPWTVTATLLTDTASDTVMISSNKQYDIKLIYEYMFVKNGVLNTLFPWYIDETTHTGSSITQESGAVRFVTGGNITTVFSTQNPVDLTDYTALRMTVISGASYRGGNYMPCIGVGRNRPTSGGTPASISGIDAFTLLNTQTGAIQGTYTVDISALNGLYYVDLVLGGSVTITGESGFVNVTQFGLHV